MILSSKMLKTIPKAETVFLTLALIFGTVFLVITPPFQVPDEPNHFYRAFQVSEGSFEAIKHDQRIGGYLPVSVKQFAEHFDKIIAGAKFTRDTSGLNILSMRLETQTRIFVDFNNTALYSPLCYVPQSLAITVFRLFDASVPTLFYAARAFTMLFWIGLIFISIRITPVCKWLFCLLALLPMSLSINSSVSADVMTNGICFLFISVILNSRLKKNLDRKRILLIAVLVFFLPLLKSIYITLSLLLLILPYKELSSLRVRIAVCLLLFVATLLPFLAWTFVIKDMYLTYEEYNPDFRHKAALVEGVDPKKQLNQMKQHRPIFFRMIRRSTYRLAKYHVPGYVGVFGWSDVKPPRWFSYTLFSFIVFVALSEFDPRYRISWLTRTFFGVTFFVTLSAVFLTQYLTWTGMGPQVVKFIQARYLIPFYPLLFLCLYSILPIRKQVFALLVPSLSLMSLVFSVYVLFERYY